VKLEEYVIHLMENELSENTIKSYKKDILHFYNWLGEKEITKLNLIEYKKSLFDNFATSSINLKIVTINKYLRWMGYDNLKLKINKMQTKNIADEIMTVRDYERVIKMALKLKKVKIAMIMQTLRYTGIRIDELKYVTVESLKKKSNSCYNKGKYRMIVLPTKLADDLKKYCKNNNIKSGIIFTGRLGNLIDKSYVWRQMQFIAGKACVKKDKIHAHGFRHLFAKNFLSKHNNDIMSLADILGHADLKTTRIYTQKNTNELRSMMD